MIRSSAVSQARRCLQKMEEASNQLNEGTGPPSSSDPILVRQEAIENATAKAEVWREFLVYYVRFFNKLKSGCQIGPAKGWYDRLVAEQRADELLNYLVHARNALEHRLEHGEVAEFGPQPRTLTIDLGPNAKPHQFIYDPYRLKLKKVIDRGVIYSAPSTHLGETIKNGPISYISKLVVEHLSGVLRDAESMTQC